MNKRSIVILCTVIALAVFALGTFLYPKPTSTPVASVEKVADDSLVREHSPILGSPDAPVTIVEFFDPSCGACRAFYPHVEEIMEQYPTDVRLVLRYAAFHQGSDEAVRILEASRLQDKFHPVLEALFSRQAAWSADGGGDVNEAWEIAGAAGLDIAQAKVHAARPEIANVLKLDSADIKANDVRQTPTFFINGRKLLSVSPEQLLEQVTSEVLKAKESTNQTR